MFRFTKSLVCAALVGALTVSPAALVAPASAVGAFSLPSGHLTITIDDLKYILDQIKIGQAHAARTATPLASLRPTGITTPTIVYPYDVTSATRCLTAVDIQTAETPAFGVTGLTNIYPFLNTEMWGLRQVDGQCNNITNVIAQTAPTAVVGATSPAAPDTSAWGAADQRFPRLSASAISGTQPFTLTPTQNAYQNPTSFVKDPSARIISNIVSDQSINNPAATAASDTAHQTLYGTGPAYENSVNATTGAVTQVAQIPNVTPDFNASAGFNSWFTLFGQFYDHGLDLIPKNGASVYIPLQQSDPLYVPGAPNFMVLTRGADSNGESINTTTPYVDQSQTYGSHASQNFFLREYSFAAGTGIPTPTGRLIESTDTDYTTLPSAWLANRTVGGTLVHATGGADLTNGGLATWKDIKAQALLLGIQLSDYDVNSIPVVATNQYGAFIPGPTGMPMVLFTNGTSYAWVSGTAASPVSTGAVGGGTTLPGLAGSNWIAVSTGHVFLNDTMSTAVPFDRTGAPLTADADNIMNSPSTIAPGYYDNENLEAHYIAGDGRVNENAGLSAVHHVFHAEHNTVAGDIVDLLANNPDVTADFRGEWNGERIYQAARFINEMEYQHMVFDEFIRRISPSLPVFLGYDPTIKADITAEFASAVYRVGHSMLNETIARSNPGSFYSATSNQDLSLLTGFTNPAQARLASPAVVASAVKTGSSVVYTLETGEVVPAVGDIVSVSGLDNAALNLVNAVVDSRTATSFTVSSRYAGGASSSATTLPSGSDSASSIVGPDGALVATAIVNDPGNNGYDYTPGQSAAAIAQGMSSQRGNEIDEFVTDSVRNNLLGLPLDLASLNITRGRDVGIPTLNQFRTLHAASLTPYASWSEFIANLRHAGSAVNLIAAYGTHPSLTEPATVGSVSAATAVSVGGGNVSITYDCPSTAGITVGDVVSISGLTDYNVSNAVVDSLTASTFTVTTAWARNPLEPKSFATGALLRSDAAAAISGSAGTAAPTGSSGSVTAAPSVTERRARAQAILDLTVPDAIEFLDGSGAWTGVETGLNYVDLWLGGLAESPAMQPVTPPLLGTTFQFVFEDQSLKLQDGDRFYYLGRIAGTNLGEEIPAQKLTDIVRRNTPSANASRSVASASGLLGMNSPGFGIADCAWSNTPSFIPASAQCPAGSTAFNTLGVLIHKGLDNTTGFADPYSTTPAKLTGGGGDDALFGGAGDDLLNAGIGGDLVDGAEGNDRILGLGGEDLMRGGPGDDVINGGESQAGDVADGNMGNDWLHCGNCTGAIASYIGETGNDFLQGGKSADLLLQGGEGSDWIEGLAGVDWLQGDSGLLGGGASPALHGGDDVLTGGAGIDIIFSDAGDDIVNAGDSADAIDSAYGFDWVNYQGNKRLDNGGNKAGVYLDLSGVRPNPLNNNGDAVLDSEAIAGSPGPDILVGGLGADVTVPNVTGVAGATTLVLSGAWPQIIGGMVVRGTGIGANATVVGPGAIVVLNGVTTTTVDLTVPHKAAVRGPIEFTTYPLTNPGLISGLTSLLSNTRGWLKYAAVNPASTKWTGGTLLFGGAGNDQLTPMGGENVLDGSASMRTCLVVTKAAAPYTTGADTDCGGGRGYTSMSLLSAAMDAGTISPTNVSVVREIVRNSALVTSVTTTGTTATYTAAGHNLTVGDYVTVVGSNPSMYNINNVLVTAVTATTFTVASPLAAGTSALTAGRAKATDTLVLPNAEDLYTVLPMPTLPSGVSVGYLITGPQGFVDTVYDMDMVSFAGLPAKALSATGSALGNVTVSNGTWPVSFSPETKSYTVIVPVGTTSVNVTAWGANLGTTMTLQGTAQRSGEARAITLGTGATTVTYVTTAPDGVNRSTYTLSIVRLAPQVTASNWTTTATGFGFTVTNYSASYTYTCTTTAGTCTAGTAAGTNRPYTISGLASGASATATITATRTGYATTSATITGTAGALAALTSTVSAATARADGFTFNVTNYNALYTYTATSSLGTVTVGTAVGATLPITVSGLSPGQASQVVLTTSRPGYLSSLATVNSAATVATLTPSLTVTERTLTGLTVAVNNWVAGYTYTCTVTAGSCALGAGSGTRMLATVTRLTAGQATTVTIRATRTGVTAGSASIATGALATGLVSLFDPPSRTGTTLTVNINNYNPAFAYLVTSSRGTVTKALPVGTSLVITVTNAGTSATVTVATLQLGYGTGLASVTG